MCNWFGLCGLAHLRHQSLGPKHSNHKVGDQIPMPGHEQPRNFSSFWNSGQENPDEWSKEERKSRKIPKYVLEYAPLIHLYSGERYWPCDIAEHLIHTTPHLNYTPLQAESDHPNLTNLNELNQWGRHVFLHSDDNVEDYPDWLGGETNIPTKPGHEKTKHFPGLNKPPPNAGSLGDGEDEPWFNVGEGDVLERGGVRFDPNDVTAMVPERTNEGDELKEIRIRGAPPKPVSHGEKGGRSDAPAVLVVVPKGNGVVDAFWFFFYSFNLGNTVFNVRFGNHVGDWEHTVIRFYHGKPKAVFFSEHDFGEAYSWEALEKIGKRVSCLCWMLQLANVC
jgi:hypothetical protein